MFDNTIFNLLRKRFATIGAAGAILPTGWVNFFSNFFSGNHKANNFGCWFAACVSTIKNSLSV